MPKFLLLYLFIYSNISFSQEEKRVRGLQIIPSKSIENEFYLSKNIDSIESIYNPVGLEQLSKRQYKYSSPVLGKKDTIPDLDENIVNNSSESNVIGTREVQIQKDYISREKKEKLIMTPVEKTPEEYKALNITSKNDRPKIQFIKNKIIEIEQEIITNKDNPYYDIKNAEKTLEDLRASLID